MVVTMDGNQYQRPKAENSRVRHKAWGIVLVVFTASRLFYLLAGALLVNIVPIHPFQQESLDVPFGTLSVWAHFDGEQYVSIADTGYYSRPQALFSVTTSRPQRSFPFIHYLCVQLPPCSVGLCPQGCSQFTEFSSLWSPSTLHSTSYTV